MTIEPTERVGEICFSLFYANEIKMCCLDVFELNLTDRRLLAIASVCCLGKLYRALTRIIDTVADFIEE